MTFTRHFRTLTEYAPAKIFREIVHTDPSFPFPSPAVFAIESNCSYIRPAISSKPITKYQTAIAATIGTTVCAVTVGPR